MRATKTPVVDRGLRVRGAIARGAQGSVYLVHDRGLGRFLALKVIEVADDAAARSIADRVRRFASGEADPPVAILELWLEAEAPVELVAGLPKGGGGPRLLILMPLVLGPTLRELVEGDPAFGVVETACALALVAQRLRRLPPGLAHGDLKPENVLVDDGRLFVIDPLAGLALGSPPYAAPEQRSGADPRPPADVHALATMGLVLLAGRFPREGDPAGLLPPLREPPPNAPAEVRRAFAALAPRLAAGRHPEADRRESMEELAKGLLDIAGGLAGADLAAPLAAAGRRARRPERLAVVAAEMDRARSESPGSEPVADGRKETRRSFIGLVALSIAAAALAIAGVWWFRRPAVVDAVAPEVASMAAPEASRCPVSPPARLLKPLEEALPSEALFEETVEQPAKRVTLKVLNGPALLVLSRPQPGTDCKIALPPGLYRWDEVYPGGEKDGHDLELEAKQNERDTTHEYRHSAPADPDWRHAQETVPFSAGPVELFEGPLRMVWADWNADAGTVAIGSVDAGCAGPARALPPTGPLGRGTFDEEVLLGEGEPLCAVPDAAAGRDLDLDVMVTYRMPPTPPHI